MDTTPERGWIRHLPNLLSSLRILLALTFVFAPVVWRLPLVVAAGTSDWLDGLIARRFGVQSIRGGLLDGVADKLFVVSVLITWAVEGRMALWQVALLLARDLVVAYVCAYWAFRGRWEAFRGMPARPAGKWTTILLFVMFCALLIPLPSFACGVLLALTAASSVVAGVDYAVQFHRARVLDAGSNS